MLQKKKMILPMIIFCSFILLIAGCSTITELAGIKDPEIKLKNVSLLDLSFDKTDLLLEIDVVNPNKFSLDLDGYNYDFIINKTSFVKGKQQEIQSIKANGNSRFQVPIELKFKNLYNTFQSLSKKDSVDYDVLLGFDFDLPVVGKTTFSVNDSGSLPLPKIPTIKFKSFKLDKLSLTKANLILDIDIENPNSFDLILNNFIYNLNIDGKSWAKSASNEKINIPEKGKTVLSIPVSLNFLTMGKSVYQSLTSSEPLEYNLTGKMDLITSLPIMKELVLPIEKKGKINILR